MITLPTQVPEPAAATFDPFLLGWIVLLPLIGFAINGVAAIVAARTRLLAARTGGLDASELEAHTEDHLEHPATETPREPTGRAWTHQLPTFVAPGVLALSFLIATINFFRMLGTELAEPIVQTYWSWMPVGTLQVDAALQLDSLSMLMTMIVTGVGTLIHIFSVGYMRQDPGYPRYFAYLNLFVFFMLVLVLGASFPVMFVGWEGVGLCSYLLIGFWFKEKVNADAGKKAFIVNRIGDAGFLVAMFLIFAHLGTLNFTEVFAQAPQQLAFGGAVATAIVLFLFLGVTGKSAQIPLYVWLPDAMAGPTPVSALIHAATMVTAGVYLMVRAGTLLALAPAAMLVIALVGALTAIFAATIGLNQWDIKKVLAYSTVSQLGFMVAAVGMGAFAAGVFHLMTHAFFKALLFLGAGAVIHAMHEALHATHSTRDAQDMRNMGGLRGFMPWTFATMGIATLAIAGIPPFAGFFSKDEIIGAAWIGSRGESALSEAVLFGVSGSVWMGAVGVILTLAALLTAFYMGRLMLYTFFGPNRTGETERGHLHEAPGVMKWPLVGLAVLSVIGGLFNVESGVPIVEWFAPVAIGGMDALHNFLAPVTYPASGILAAELGSPYATHPAWPIVLAIVIGAGGLLLAWLLLKPAQLGVEGEEPDYTNRAGRMLFNKWFVDEVYHGLVVRPVVGMSRVFSTAVDRTVIDGGIDRMGRAAQAVGLMGSRFQSGRLNTYAFAIVIGAVLVLLQFTGIYSAVANLIF
jgi:NADH-quinone oxidoreductase subunit L